MSKKEIPKRRNREKTRATILNAGTKLFARYGFESTTTKQIARSADVNEVMIARYFKNKAGLLAAILVSLIENAGEQSDARPPADTLEEELTLLMREKCRAYIEKRDVHKIAISRLLIDPKLSAQVHKLVYPVAEKTIAKRLKVYLDRGQINSSHDLPKLAKMVQIECVGILTMMCIRQRVQEKDIFKMVDYFAPILALGFRQAQRNGSVEGR